MSTAVVQVAFVNQPKQGKSKGSIKTNEGEFFEVWPNQLGLFRPGASYEIDFAERTWNGKVYRTVAKCRPQDRPAVVKGRHGDTIISEPEPVSQEFEFVARVLSASIQACAVEYTQQGLAEAARMLRNVYREAMR